MCCVFQKWQLGDIAANKAVSAEMRPARNWDAGKNATRMFRGEVA